MALWSAGRGSPDEEARSPAWVIESFRQKAKSGMNPRVFHPEEQILSKLSLGNSNQNDRDKTDLRIDTV